MSSTPKIAVITAASIGVVLTQSSTLLAEKQEQQKEIAAATDDLDDEVLYSALPDEALERAAGGVGACLSLSCAAQCNAGQTSNCNTGIANKANKKVPPLSKSRTSK